MYYPWQTRQWQQLMTAKQAGRLPHALLLSGMAGTGKTTFAYSFVRTMLCETGAGKNIFYCNTCHSCRLAAGRVHPNIYWLEPEKAGHAIKVDQIRAASEFVAQSSLKGEYRFVIINPADNMNINAANALLKTLEEPANNAMLVLISGESRRLPATIISRCQRIVFPKPDRDLALAWICEQGEVTHPELLLRLANGAPFTALRIMRDETLKQREGLYQVLSGGAKSDPVRAASALLEQETLVFLDYMLAWVMDLLRLQLGIDAAELTNADYVPQLTALKKQTRLSRNSHFLSYLQHLRGQICTGFNLNKQLVMENVLIRWMDCFGLET